MRIWPSAASKPGRSARVGATTGPFTGAGQQWTEYAVGHVPYVWALTAALLPRARSWCVEQPAALLREVSTGTSREIAVLATWLTRLFQLPMHGETQYG
jgi:hypothetical protein